jgi:hypothetical protein
MAISEEMLIIKNRSLNILVFHFIRKILTGKDS